MLKALFFLLASLSICKADFIMPYGRAYSDVLTPDPSCPDRCGVRWRARPLSLPEPMMYFDELVDEVSMIVHGYLEIGNDPERPFSGFSRPQTLPATNLTGLVAVHWRSVYFEDGGNMAHRVTNSSLEDLSPVKDFIQTCDGGHDFVPEHAIVATWDYLYGTCGFWMCIRSARFQLVMAYSGDTTWAVFAYKSLQYPVEGLVARRGFNSMDGEAGYTIGDAFGVEELLEVVGGTNCGADYPGVYGYDVSTRYDTGGGGGGGGGETGTLIMVNARGDVDVDIGPIENGQQYDRSELGRSYTVRAEGFTGEVGSVVFSLDGVEYNIENSSPYYMNTKRRENARRVPEFAEIGTHTVTATAWSEADGTGMMGEAVTATFEIVR